MFLLVFLGFPWLLELLEVLLELLELVLSLSLSYLNVFLVSAVGVYVSYFHDLYKDLTWP